MLSLYLIVFYFHDKSRCHRNILLIKLEFTFVFFCRPNVLLIKKSTKQKAFWKKVKKKLPNGMQHWLEMIQDPKSTTFTYFWWVFLEVLQLVLLVIKFKKKNKKTHALLYSAFTRLKIEQNNKIHFWILWNIRVSIIIMFNVVMFIGIILNLRAQLCLSIFSVSKIHKP